MQHVQLEVGTVIALCRSR